MNKILLAFLSVLFLTSCGKNIVRIGQHMKPKDELRLQEFDFGYMTAKSKIEFQDAKNDIKATANIRMRKDSLIWISLSATLGIEAARCLISTDSIIVMDRVNKEYFIYTYPTLSKQFHFDIDYDIIQAMILGTMPKKKKESDEVDKIGEYFIVAQDTGPIGIKNFISTKTMKLIRVSMEEKTTENQLILNYGDFQYLNEYIFPYKSLLALKYSATPTASEKKETRISIDYNKAEIDDKSLKFPFNIPQKYTFRRAI